jgi:hypothetical protein
MEIKESVKFDLTCVLAAAYAVVLISLVRQRGIALAVSAHIGIVLGLSIIRFGQEFLRILFLPLVAIITVIENWRVQRYVKAFKRNVPKSATFDGGFFYSKSVENSRLPRETGIFHGFTSGRGGGNRTHVAGFGDQRPTIERRPYRILPAHDIRDCVQNQG